MERTDVPHLQRPVTIQYLELAYAENSQEIVSPEQSGKMYLDKRVKAFLWA